MTLYIPALVDSEQDGASIVDIDGRPGTGARTIEISRGSPRPD